MPSESEARQIPVRVKMRMEAVGLWAFLSIPSIAVTVCLLEFQWIRPLKYIVYPDIDLDLCRAISGVENFDGRL